MVEIINPISSDFEAEYPSSSYNTSLLVKQDYEIPKKPTKGTILFTLSFLFSLAILVILIGSADQCSVVPNLIQDDEMSSSSSSPETVRPPWTSRGVSEGVSEKAFRPVSGNWKSFPWNETMLSFQRTAYHYQPEKNWMNGPMFYNEWYHVFHQYNPDAAVWGNITWAHAVSKDLIHWLYLPLAMVRDQWYDINGVWSGSATLLPNGSIVMTYTGSTNESVQVQNVAVPANLSDPLLLYWVKYSGNPVLVPPPGIGSKDFRDPTTLWYVSGKWRTMIGSKIDLFDTTGIALVYETTDFLNYKLLNGLMHQVPTTGMWECIDFYPISITSAKGLENSVHGPDVKHVLKASLDDTKIDHYALGTYDPLKNTWTPDDPELDVGIGIRYDYGKYYASKAFYDQNTERRVLWGWIGETDSERSDIKKGWSGLQGIPREVTFDMKTKTNIIQWPVVEVESLRGASIEFDNIQIEPGLIVPLNLGTATQLDITAELEIDAKALEKTMEADLLYNCNTSNGAAGRGALGPFGLLVLADETHVEQTAVYFYIAKGTDGRVKTFFCTDQLRSSEAEDVDKPVYGSTVPVLDGEKLTMRILVDHSIVEAFAQGGRTCITSRIYPTRAIYEAAKVFIFNNATETTVTITSLKIWQMNPADIRPYPL